MSTYYAPKGGLPPQSPRLPSRAVFTEAYVYIPREVMSDIVTSFLPHWADTRAWILARPLSGFAETFSQYLMEVAPGGGTSTPDEDRTAQSVLFILEGEATIWLPEPQTVRAGHFIYIPAGTEWALKNESAQNVSFSWIRKRFEPVRGLPRPEVIVAHDEDVAPIPMIETDMWATTRFIDPNDMRHDMHMNIVTFQPGGVIPFDETHVMEHGIYMIEGTAIYRVNGDDIEVQAGDFLWLRAFCPQSCVATGDGPFRYLLYKDVNRHASLTPFGAT